MGRSRSRSPVADRRDGGRDRDAPRKYRSDELHSVRIGNDLPNDVSIDEIKDVFGKFGEIGDVFLPKDRDTGDTRGFGFVRFVKKEDQDYCLKECEDGIKVAGVDTKVEFTRPRDQSRGRGGYGGGRGGGYGGRSGGYGGGYSGRDDRRGGGGYGRDDRRGGGGYGRDDRRGGGRDDYYRR